MTCLGAGSRCLLLVIERAAARANVTAKKVAWHLLTPQFSVPNRRWEEALGAGAGVVLVDGAGDAGFEPDGGFGPGTGVPCPWVPADAAGALVLRDQAGATLARRLAGVAVAGATGLAATIGAGGAAGLALGSAGGATGLAAAAGAGGVAATLALGAAAGTTGPTVAAAEPVVELAGAAFGRVSDATAEFALGVVVARDGFASRTGHRTCTGRDSARLTATLPRRKSAGRSSLLGTCGSPRPTQLGAAETGACWGGGASAPDAGLVTRTTATVGVPAGAGSAPPVASAPFAAEEGAVEEGAVEEDAAEGAVGGV
jgi:hypothetical protein